MWRGVEQERCKAKRKGNRSRQCREGRVFTVVTIAREYGSGGSDIRRKVAELLGWMCVRFPLAIL
jgi:hypothetical protein